VRRELAALGLACAALVFSRAAALDAPTELDLVVTVSDVSVGDGAIEALLTNHGLRELHDLRLQIEYVYHWPDEMHPGDESPGRAWSHVLPGPLAPGASERLVFHPPGGLPTAPGGRFEPKVTVVGFTEVGE
jgi:hypothetical protein